jgi:hypothetical protein
MIYNEPRNNLQQRTEVNNYLGSSAYIGAWHYTTMHQKQSRQAKFGEKGEK